MSFQKPQQTDQLYMQKFKTLSFCIVLNPVVLSLETGFNGNWYDILSLSANILYVLYIHASNVLCFVCFLEQSLFVDYISLIFNFLNPYVKC